jgi:isopentenyl-diphosphate delta-isomerase
LATSDRKKAHVELTASGRADYVKTSGFEKYDFVHHALPEISPSDVALSATLLNRSFGSPLFVSSMTGGYAEGKAVNEILARFCQEHHLPMGVGSMRAMLEDPSLAPTFSIVRKVAPDAFIAANIGGAQLIDRVTVDFVEKLTEPIGADAVIVHLNVLQELMQPEGDRFFKGIKEGIAKLVDLSPVPVIVKETGAGISGSVARTLNHECGVRVIDVAGAGGTSWAKVENQRRTDSENDAQLFDDWGMPTSHCLIDIKTQHLPDLEIIGSGGIRNAHDIVKSLCMGASMAGMAGEIIKIVVNQGESELHQWYEQLIRHLQFTMCLLGVSGTEELGMQLLRRL